MNELHKIYKTKIAGELARELGIKNSMAVQKLMKIVINCGIGEATEDKKVVEKMAAQIATITGQKPVLTKAKKAISTFKLREGDIIGIKVTLRSTRMYDFMMKFIGLALPRVRDFRGIPRTGFDGHGNYTMGVVDQTIFSELDYSMIDKTRGFEITFVTTAENDEQALLLLEKLGMPFTKLGS